MRRGSPRRSRGKPSTIHAAFLNLIYDNLGLNSELVDVSPCFGHVRKCSLKFSIPQNIDPQNSTVRQFNRFGLRSNLNLAVVVIRVLIQHSTANTRPDANDAVIEDCSTTEAASVGHEQRNFDRPHASSDEPVNVVLFEPISSSFHVAQADMQSGSIQTGIFQNTDDYIRGSGHRKTCR